MKKLILLTLIVILTACSSIGTFELNKNKTKWKDANITHYRYNLAIGCFCPFRNDMPLTIEVKDGAPVSIATNNGTVIDATNKFYQLYIPYSTIDGIMLNLETELTGNAYKVAVIYDPAYGFPASINIDRIKNAVDDETSYQITNFEILK